MHTYLTHKNGEKHCRLLISQSKQPQSCHRLRSCIFFFCLATHNLSVNNCSIFIRVKYCVSQLLDKVKGDPGLTFYVALFQYLPHSPFHSHTDGGGCHARCQLHIRSNLGFSFLLKATLTCSSAHSGGTGILISRIRTCNLPITR